jgi:hypothetical protein
MPREETPNSDIFNSLQSIIKTHWVLKFCTIIFSVSILPAAVRAILMHRKPATAQK